MEKTIWDLLENPPKNCQHIAELCSLSMNYENKTGTAYIEFLDIIGYSQEEYGQRINAKGFELDYLAADYLAHALLEWSSNPLDAIEFIKDLDGIEH
jgi:hypothetical protein